MLILSFMLLRCVRLVYYLGCVGVRYCIFVLVNICPNRYIYYLRGIRHGKHRDVISPRRHVAQTYVQ